MRLRNQATAVRAPAFGKAASCKQPKSLVVWPHMQQTQDLVSPQHVGVRDKTLSETRWERAMRHSDLSHFTSCQEEGAREGAQLAGHKHTVRRKRVRETLESRPGMSQ
ncbi:uncharacterized protein THITE_2115273 [Thermothielavioides terrestris NRRL 8126]|uniref:Uncharacterized protein n=1 Tax=Thermothielavioides terrestris (strain ATCC 38088 / NRRL 8126) TaxID=578455 RepID=G2R3W8_THETT|nr:uncharacterized protein THITE_2115273 [Thermothielavioides terrestris NRRL 8126]AEO66820.1 hypothetical protein THITE_2115273 [Thermothielavioides terrestris NRRL 8126]